MLGQIGTIVTGHGAYEDMVRGWSGSDNPMAVLMNTLPKVVFSQSLALGEGGFTPPPRARQRFAARGRLRAAAASPRVGWGTSRSSSLGARALRATASTG
jgi:hypothetical protein